MKPTEIFNVLFLSAQAIENVAGNARIASAITFRNEVIAFGFNQMKTHTLQAKYSKNPNSIFLHSEIDVLRRSLNKISVDDLKKCDLYICRAKRKDKTGPFITGLSYPCAGCMRAIAAFGIKNVFYSIENDEGFQCI
jgi:tRNA(Arg) A34 adenosine deaminase TadA